MHGDEIKCGEGGIRTHGPVSETPVFKTGAFDRSATSPGFLVTPSLMNHAQAHETSASGVAHEGSWVGTRRDR